MATMDLTLHIEGMTCGACVARVEAALRTVPGVTGCAVNLTTSMASVSLDVHGARSGGMKTAADIHEMILAAVAEAGYKGHILEGAAADTMKAVAVLGEAYERKVERRLIVGILFGVPAIAIGMLMQHQMYMAMHWGASFHGGYNILEAVLATVVITATGWPFFAGAWRALRHGSANMDVLVALGAGTAYVASVVSLVMWLAAGGESQKLGAEDFPMPRLAEFHAAVAIIVLVTLGKYLEARAKKRASSAVAGLASSAAEMATRIRMDGKVETVAAHLVNLGDKVQVVAHQTVPVDGMVIEGAGTLDQSLLTGESTPVEILVRRNPSPHARPSGISVPGGSRLLDGRIVIEATSTAGTSTVAKILELVNTAQASKTNIQGLADRVAGIFVPIVLVLAAANFVVWMWVTGGLAGDWQRAMMTTIATVVIACPCAMGLATPTAITVAMGRAAKMGILFTQATALETARDVGTVLFDKTGTLTRGRPEVARVQVVSGQWSVARDEAEVVRLAASVEQFSEHPLAKAVVEYAQMQGVALVEPERFRSTPGGGVRATIAGAGGGRELAAGSMSFMESLGIEVDRAGFEGLVNQGMTVIGLGDVGAKRMVGLMGLRDMLREDAGETIRRLRARGVKVGIVSGDTEAAVRGALEGVAVDSVWAGVKPEGKAAIVENAKREARSAKQGGGGGVAFVGDGINDGPALAAADLGIAMAGGTQIAKSAGDVILTGDYLMRVPEVLELSRRTLRIIQQNLFWAFAYNVAAIPLAMAGVLTPGFAAGAMMLSSLTVVGNALRLYGGAGGRSQKLEARSQNREGALQK